MLVSIQVAKGFRRVVARRKQAGVANGLEQPSSDDFKTLLRVGRTPRRLNSSDRVLEGDQRLSATRAADFFIMHTGRRRYRCCIAGCWHADHQHGLRRGLGFLTQSLREREMRLKIAAGQILLLVQLPCIGHPFINQNQTRRILPQQLADGVAGIGRRLVCFLHHGVAILPAKLPCELAPECSDDCAVVLPVGLTGRNLVADDDDAANSFGQLAFCLLEHDLQPREILLRMSGKQVVESEHRMGLAAAEIGLQFHHRIGRLPGHSAHRAHEQILQAGSEKRPAKELNGVAVFG